MKQMSTSVILTKGCMKIIKGGEVTTYGSGHPTTVSKLNIKDEKNSLGSVS